MVLGATSLVTALPAPTTVILADGEAAKDGSVGAYGGAFFDYYGHDLPVGFGLQTAAGSCGPGVAIVDEHDTVAAQKSAVSTSMAWTATLGESRKMSSSSANDIFS